MVGDTPATNLEMRISTLNYASRESHMPGKKKTPRLSAMRGEKILTVLRTLILLYESLCVEFFFAQSLQTLL